MRSFVHASQRTRRGVSRSVSPSRSVGLWALSRPAPGRPKRPGLRQRSGPALPEKGLTCGEVLAGGDLIAWQKGPCRIHYHGHGSGTTFFSSFTFFLPCRGDYLLFFFEVEEIILLTVGVLANNY